MEHIFKKKCPKCGTVMHYNDLDGAWLLCHECGYEEKEDK